MLRMTRMGATLLLQALLALCSVAAFQTQHERHFKRPTNHIVSPTSDNYGRHMPARRPAPTPTCLFMSSRQNRVQSLLDWAKQTADIQFSEQALQLTFSDTAGLGFVTNQDVSSGQVILQVPDNVALTVEVPGSGPNDGGTLERTCRKSERGSFRLEKMPWYVQFSLYLHTLKSATNNNNENMVDRKPWLDSLPTAFDTPIHWTESQRKEWLQYDTMVKSVERQETMWKSKFQTVSPVFPAMSWDDFCWGCETARSRAFSASTAGRFNPGIYAFTLVLVAIYVGLGLGTLEQAANGAGVVFSATVLKDFVLPKFFSKKLYAICPVIDMANHNSLSSNAQVSLEYFANAYSLATSLAVQQGQAIEISYGARSNDQLLQYYGFVEPNNPNDVYIMPPLREWPLQAMEEATGRPVAAGRLEKLDRAGLLGRSTASAPADDEDEDEAAVSNPWGGVVVTRVEGIDPAVIQALRALFSTEVEWDAAGQAVGNFAEAVSAENEKAVYVAAKTALELELQSKATSLQQDLDQLDRIEKGSSSLEDKLIDKEEVLAIRFRIEKKSLLSETIAKL